MRRVLERRWLQVPALLLAACAPSDLPPSSDVGNSPVVSPGSAPSRGAQLEPGTPHEVGAGTVASEVSARPCGVYQAPVPGRAVSLSVTYAVDANPQTAPAPGLYDPENEVVPRRDHLDELLPRIEAAARCAGQVQVDIEVFWMVAGDIVGMDVKGVEGQACWDRCMNSASEEPMGEGGTEILLQNWRVVGTVSSTP